MDLSEIAALDSADKQSLTQLNQLYDALKKEGDIKERQEVDAAYAAYARQAQASGQTPMSKYEFENPRMRGFMAFSKLSPEQQKEYLRLAEAGGVNLSVGQQTFERKTGERLAGVFAPDFMSDTVKLLTASDPFFTYSLADGELSAYMQLGKSVYSQLTSLPSDAEITPRAIPVGNNKYILNFDISKDDLSITHALPGEFTMEQLNELLGVQQ